MVAVPCNSLPLNETHAKARSRKKLQWWLLLLLLLEMFLYGRIKSMIWDEMMVCQR